MSTTTKSSMPSRLMSAKSTPIEDMGICRIASGATTCRPRPPVFRQNPSRDRTKSLQTYSSGSRSPSRSRKATLRAQSRGGSVSERPCASRKAPAVHDTGPNEPPPLLR
jgi:hypothetical protein